MSVKVTLGDGTTKELPYKEGENVGYYLKAAEAVLTKKATLSLNGNMANERAKVDKDGAVIIVAPKIGNG